MNRFVVSLSVVLVVAEQLVMVWKLLQVSQSMAILEVAS